MTGGIALMLLAASVGCSSPSQPTTTATLSVHLQASEAADQASVDALPVTVVSASGETIQARAQNGLATFVVPDGQYDVGIEWLTPIRRPVTVPPSGANLVVVIGPDGPEP